MELKKVQSRSEREFAKSPTVFLSITAPLTCPKTDYRLASRLLNSTESPLGDLVPLLTLQVAFFTLSVF